MAQPRNYDFFDIAPESDPRKISSSNWKAGVSHILKKVAERLKTFEDDRPPTANADANTFATQKELPNCPASTPDAVRGVSSCSAEGSPTAHLDHLTDLEAEMAVAEGRCNILKKQLNDIHAVAELAKLSSFQLSEKAIQTSFLSKNETTSKVKKMKEEKSKLGAEGDTKVTFCGSEINMATPDPQEPFTYSVSMDSSVSLQSSLVRKLMGRKTCSWSDLDDSDTKFPESPKKSFKDHNPLQDTSRVSDDRAMKVVKSKCDLQFTNSSVTHCSFTKASWGISEKVTQGVPNSSGPFQSPQEEDSPRNKETRRIEEKKSFIPDAMKGERPLSPVDSSPEISTKIESLQNIIELDHELLTEEELEKASNPLAAGESTRSKSRSQKPSSSTSAQLSTKFPQTRPILSRPAPRHGCYPSDGNSTEVETESNVQSSGPLLTSCEEGGEEEEGGHRPSTSVLASVLQATGICRGASRPVTRGKMGQKNGSGSGNRNMQPLRRVRVIPQAVFMNRRRAPDPIDLKGFALPTKSSLLKQSLTLAASSTNGTRRYSKHFRLRLRDIPFVLGKSTTPSHHVGVNVQQVLAMLKMHQRPICSAVNTGCNYPAHSMPMPMPNPMCKPLHMKEQAVAYLPQPSHPLEPGEMQEQQYGSSMDQMKEHVTYQYVRKRRRELRKLLTVLEEEYQYLNRNYEELKEKNSQRDENTNDKKVNELLEEIRTKIAHKEEQVVTLQKLYSDMKRMHRRLRLKCRSQEQDPEEKLEPTSQEKTMQTHEKSSSLNDTLFSNGQNTCNPLHVLKGMKNIQTGLKVNHTPKWSPFF